MRCPVPVAAASLLDADAHCGPGRARHRDAGARLAAVSRPRRARRVRRRADAGRVERAGRRAREMEDRHPGPRPLEPGHLRRSRLRDLRGERQAGPGAEGRACTATSSRSRTTRSTSWKVTCLDRKTGKVKWQQDAVTGVPKIKRHTKATHANSTMATDGSTLVAFFGSEGLYRLRPREGHGCAGRRTSASSTPASSWCRPRSGALPARR